MPALALDIGGAKLAAAVVDGAGTILGRGLTPTPRGGDAGAVFAALCAAADRAIGAAGISAGISSETDDASRGLAADLDGIGVATAGPMDMAEGTVSPVNISAWRDFPLRAELAGRYGLPVHMFGDALAVTVAEHWLGAAQGLDNVLGMVMSTGIGGGLILSGRVMSGTGGNAGHIGHVSIDAAGPPCPCGGVGCLEAIASGTAIGRWAAEHTADRAEPLTDARAVAAAPRVVPAALGSDAGVLGAAAVVLHASDYRPSPSPLRL